MVNLNATSPQLKAVKSVVEIYGSRDLNSGSTFSKDFKFQSFPKTPDHVEETRGEHFKNYGGVLSSYAGMEVSAQHRGSSNTKFLTLISTIRSPYFTRSSKHREELSSTFVLPHITATLSQVLTRHYGADDGRVVHR